jgi:hypothetical protein
MIVMGIYTSGSTIFTFIDIPSVLIVVVGSYMCIFSQSSISGSLDLFNTIGLCFKVPVFKERGKGKNMTSKLIVSPKKFNGIIRNISAGGCSIRTPAPVQAGSRLKINCNVGNNEQVSVLGQVIRSNRSSAGTVINVKFLKVPMRAFNSINTLVFGFNEGK